MAETWTPVTLTNDTGQKLNAAYFNRVETGIDEIDVRLNGVENRVGALDQISNVGNHSGALTLNAGPAGPVKLITLTGNATFAFSGAQTWAAFALELVLTQDATGGRTVTWPASVRWSGATPPTLSTAGGTTDRLVFVTYDGGTTWYGDLVGKGYA